MAFASCSRLTSSFDWQTALPQGQSNLPPSILVMSDSRQVLTMSQETSSPCGSLVARMSQILILQALRACFSARSSGVSSVLRIAAPASPRSRGFRSPARWHLGRTQPGPETSVVMAAIRATRASVMELPLCGPYPEDGGVWSGAEAVSSTRGQAFAMRSSAEMMALPISAVPMVRQPSCAMSAVR